MQHPQSHEADTTKSGQSDGPAQPDPKRNHRSGSDAGTGTGSLVRHRKESRADRRSREARNLFPKGAWFNFDPGTEDGRLIAYFCDDAGAPEYMGYKVVDGPFESAFIANSRARPEYAYPYLLRTALERGIIKYDGTHVNVTKPMLAEWCGFAKETIEAWLRPRTNRSWRPMPRRAIRFILLEFQYRDHSKYNWKQLIKLAG